jgi:hypothetical protein
MHFLQAQGWASAGFGKRGIGRRASARDLAAAILRNPKDAAEGLTAQANGHRPPGPIRLTLVLPMPVRVAWRW